MYISEIKQFYKEVLSKSMEKEKLIFYFCSYVPIELIYAASYKPVKLIFESNQFLYSDEVIPKYTCPYLKTIIEFFIKNGWKEKNIIFTDGCDSSRRIFEIFKELNFLKNYFYLKVPFNENIEDIIFFKNQLNNIYKTLNENVDYDKLIESVNLYNLGRKKLLQIFNDFKFYKGSYKIYLNSLFQIIDIKDFLNLKIDLDEEKLNIEKKFYLFSTVYPINFIEYLESLGIIIDYDDSCFGERNLSLIELENNDPILSIAKYYLNREGCVRKREIDKKLEKLIKRFKEKDLKGVIIYNLKYCDPLIFSLPIIKNRLNKEKIPLLVIEDDFTLNIKSQIRTRVEAFLEMM